MQGNKFTYQSIYKLGIWQGNVAHLNVDNLIKNIYDIKQNISSVFKSNKGGYQTPSDLHYNPLFFSLVSTLNNIFSEVIQNPNFKITEMWANISSFTNYNIPHLHGKNSNYYSGVIYLKVPKNSGNIIFLNPLSVDEHKTIIPQEKDILFFPGSFPHMVEPNLSQEDRISIAFNYE